jgi:transmembrane sensor
MRADEPENRPDEDRAATIERAATEWFFRQDRGLTPEEKVEFARWLAAEVEHERMFAEIAGTWKSMASVRSRIVTVTPLTATGPAPLEATARCRRSRHWWSLSLAAAAAVALGFAAWWRSGSGNSKTFSLVASTEVGGLRTLTLPDGSTVQINTDTAVEMSFSATRRQVRLDRGEAHFNVAKDAARPFVVAAGSVAVRAVGTAFNVRRHAHAVEVLVAEGRVAVVNNQVAGTARASEIAAGQRVHVALGTVLAPPAVTPVAPEEIDKTLAWQKRRLEYVDAPLSEMIADFNRYNRHRLVIADPALAERRFGGTFQTDDYDSLVRLLEATFDVVAERRATETILRSR